MSVNTALLRKIPKIDEILKQPSIEAADCSHSILMESIRETLDSLRQNILGGNDSVSLEMDDICAQVMELVTQKNTMHLRPVINATGIILHTILGRA